MKLDVEFHASTLDAAKSTLDQYHANLPPLVRQLIDSALAPIGPDEPIGIKVIGNIYADGEENHATEIDILIEPIRPTVSTPLAATRDRR